MWGLGTSGTLVRVFFFWGGGSGVWGFGVSLFRVLGLMVAVWSSLREGVTWFLSGFRFRVLGFRV